MPSNRPIAAFYCCYLLRSTVRHGSVYVGSTPNPARRLRQHNGLAKGGAAKTSRNALRPWEMACLVTGFPTPSAALQFEWAWQNPHITLHIPPESRLQHAVAKKRSGQPKRPRHSVASLLSNLHLLLRVPSFSRWPLEVRFFSEDVYKSWIKWCKTAVEPARDTVRIIQDFPQDTASDGSESGSPGRKRRKLSGGGIESLTLDYTNQKAHFEKGRSIMDFELEGDCVLCKKALEHEGGIYTICPSHGCESVTHMTCLSRHFLEGEEEALIPVKGTCPGCQSELTWVEVVKETSLRIRGEKEVEKLLKVRRPRKEKGTSGTQTAGELSEDDDDGCADMDMEEEMEQLRKSVRASDGSQIGESWHDIDDFEDSDTGSNTSEATDVIKTTSYKAGNVGRVKAVIEDSDWDDAIEL